MKKAVFFVLALSLILFISLYYVISAPSAVFNCSPYNSLCSLIRFLDKDYAATSFLLERKRIPKQSLPILKLYLSDGALKEIDSARDKILNNPKPIMLSESLDWYAASAIVDDGISSKKTKIKLRLKGDWGDHLKNSPKLSFRIKVTKGGYIFGMRRFSIQSPKTRNYQYEALFLQEVRTHGILAPRYFFVDVRVNDYPIGVMAVEEHFSKELLEAQNRREGPILAVDENMLWQQRNINYNEERINYQKDGFNPNSNHFRVRDFPIKEFRQRKSLSGSPARTYSIRGQSLFRDFHDGKRTASNTFNLKQISMQWVLSNVWGACHGLIFHNLRFYFNLVTNALEPIAFDNNPKMYNYSFCIKSPVVEDYLQDEKFLNQVNEDIKLLRRELTDSSYTQKLLNVDEELRSYLELEKIPSKKLQVDYLLGNLTRFDSDFKKMIIPASVDYSDNISNYKLLSSGKRLSTHLRAFQFVDSGENKLELKNLTLHPVTVTEINILNQKNGQSSRLLQEEFIIPVASELDSRHIYELDLPDAPYSWDEEVYVKYSYMGKHHTREAIVQRRNHDTGMSDSFLADFSDDSRGVKIDHSEKVIWFSGGKHEINKSYVLPKNWSVYFVPGTQLILTDGALLKIRGPLYSLGEPDNRVSISMDSNEDFMQLGAWGGIAVVQAEESSVIRYTDFVGMSQVKLKNRPDYYGITGCLTFYESDVEIVQTNFKKLQCEDSLNIIRSEFVLKGVSIMNSNADSFDSDFSHGSIHSSNFINSGNDGLDLSGSVISINSSKFANISDKAISVGEKSRLTGSEITINDVSTGVSSKDLSTVDLDIVHFTNVKNNGLITYVKKEEYGPAKIRCSKCQFKDVATKAVNQHRSTIEINGENVNPVGFTEQQLIEAGYAGG